MTTVDHLKREANSMSYDDIMKDFKELDKREVSEVELSILENWKKKI